VRRWLCSPGWAALLLSAASFSAQDADEQAMAARPLMVGDLPVGTVTVRVGRGSLSNAAVGVKVEVTLTAPDGTSSKRTEDTKADGRATFSGLPVGAKFHAEVVVDGERLQTASFPIPEQGGARLMLLSSSEGEDRGEEATTNPHVGGHGHGNPAEASVDALAEPLSGHTSDPSVLKVSSSSKLFIDLREDALAVMENLVLENTSDKIFSAGQTGLAIPLPAGANNIGALEGGAHLGMQEGASMFLREAIPPAAAPGIPVQARFGFFVPTTGEGSITLRQPMPLGLDTALIMVPERSHLTLSVPGLQAVAPQADDEGAQLHIFQLAAVPRNGVLTITVSGLPTRGRLGKTVATALVAALLLAVLLGLRRHGVGARSDNGRAKLFAELVEVERARRAAGADDAPLAKRRAELVSAIEAADAATPAGKSG